LPFKLKSGTNAQTTFTITLKAVTVDGQNDVDVIEKQAITTYSSQGTAN